MKLKNPTDDKLEVQFKGVKLSIEADSMSEDFSEAQAAFILEIYHFLEEVKEEVKEVKKVKEVKEGKEEKVTKK